jgi:hypothetical protein
LVATAKLASTLVGGSDPELRSWDRTAFAPPEADDGFVEFGRVRLRIERRADVVNMTTEPGRTILNLHVEDATAMSAHLHDLGVTWLVELERTPIRPVRGADRPGWQRCPDHPDWGGHGPT